MSCLQLEIKRLIKEHSTYGYRRLWALLRYREGMKVLCFLGSTHRVDRHDSHVGRLFGAVHQVGLGRQRLPVHGLEP